MTDNGADLSFASAIYIDRKLIPHCVWRPRPEGRKEEGGDKSCSIVEEEEEQRSASVVDTANLAIPICYSKWTKLALFSRPLKE